VKIYTRTGDDGTTGLCAGPRVGKDHPRIEACGVLDELNAALGVVRAEALPDDLDALLHRIQHELFRVGADLAMPGAAAAELAQIGSAHVDLLEQAIDRFEAVLPPLREFILPGGTRAAATTHLARTVVPPRRTARGGTRRTSWRRLGRHGGSLPESTGRSPVCGAASFEPSRPGGRGSLAQGLAMTPL